MTPKPLQKGCWPKELVRRGKRVGSNRPDSVWWQEVPADTTAEDLRSVGYEVVPVLPVELVEGLVEALSECIETAEEGWGYASEHFREKWECDVQIAKARSTLASYRQAMDV